MPILSSFCSDGKAPCSFNLSPPGLHVPPETAPLWAHAEIVCARHVTNLNQSSQPILSTNLVAPRKSSERSPNHAG